MKSAAKTTTPKDQVNLALRNFLDDPKPGVLALKGPWGVGKTYVWNTFLKEYETTAKQAGYAYVSLFGINSTAELRKFLFAKHKSLTSDEKKKTLHGIKKLTPLALELFDFGVLKNTEILSEWIQDKTLRDFIICIDDLERKEDSLTGSALLGVITSLREERNCKVVLIYNDDKVPEELNRSFGEYREKVVDREITYNPSVEDNFYLIFPGGEEKFGPSVGTSEMELMFGSDRRTLLQLFESLNVTNIRVLQKTKTALEYFEPHVRNHYPKLYPTFIRQIVKICCLHYVYADRWSLEQLLGTSPWADFLSKDDNDVEKAKVRASRQPLRDIAYSPKDSDACIAEYLEKGYVDWNTHASILADAEKQHGADKLNAELTKHWSMCWDNFITPQETFISHFREFILQHYRDLRLQEVDAAVRFLQKLDPNTNLSGVLDERIAAFAEEHASIESTHIDFHNVQDETIRRVNAKITANLKPLPIDETIKCLTQEGGWTPSDVRYLAGTTADQFYEYLTSSDRISLLSTIKELRSRLDYDESSKAVLNRIDDALRRIANRSKIDELRVRQTRVELSP